MRPASLSLLILACLSACLSACGEEPMSSPAAAKAGAKTDVVTDGGIGDAKTECPPDFASCMGADRLVCKADGSGFVVEPCSAGLQCVGGFCVECAADKDCKDAATCVQGKCTVAPLLITTTDLPSTVKGTPYSTKLAATGGVLPYTWSVSQGILPPGILIDASAGSLGGSGTQPGAFSVQIKVTDAAKSEATALLVLKVEDANSLTITTTSPLKQATEGAAYTQKFDAQGGTTPYFWGVTSGALPPGLTLSTDGNLTGSPTSDGDFTFDLKALDNSPSTLNAVKTFKLPIGLAPLQIVGTQQLDLFIIKIIVLPLIVVVDKLPVPYSTKLEATGGKKPYHWSEVPMSGMIKNFLPKAGIPAGLTLADDGTLSGAVTDSTLVFELKVPLSTLTLKGFFFSGQVKDSQASPASKTAVFIIPTVPIGP